MGEYEVYQEQEDGSYLPVATGASPEASTVKKDKRPEQHMLNFDPANETPEKNDDDFANLSATKL